MLAVPLPTFAGGRIVNRRKFLKQLGSLIISGGAIGAICRSFPSMAAKNNGHGRTEGTLYGFGIQVNKCIGCNRCVVACKTENDVPKEPFFFRTWVEQYIIKSNDDVSVRTVGINAKPGESESEESVLRSCFVPKLCNQCKNPPCVQVCPVGATFQTKEGVVLVNSETCVGCRYCIQACPYGARYLHPERHTADKCTFCYHRVTKGLLPACVEVCPTQARLFGDLHSGASPLTRLKRMHKIHVLKPGLNTEPKVYYSSLDGEVR
jgi:Fe-S-cluster-containing dehydrogenase component